MVRMEAGREGKRRGTGGRDVGVAVVRMEAAHRWCKWRPLVGGANGGGAQGEERGTTVDRLTLEPSASLAPRNRPNQTFLGSEENRTNWAFVSLARRPTREPNSHNLYCGNLARGYAGNQTHSI